MTLKTAIRAFKNKDYPKFEELLKKEFEIVEDADRYESTLLRRIIELMNQYHDEIKRLHAFAKDITEGKSSSGIKSAFTSAAAKHGELVVLTRRLFRLERWTKK